MVGWGSHDLPLSLSKAALSIFTVPESNSETQSPLVPFLGFDSPETIPPRATRNSTHTNAFFFRFFCIILRSGSERWQQHQWSHSRCTTFHYHSLNGALTTPTPTTTAPEPHPQPNPTTPTTRHVITGSSDPGLPEHNASPFLPPPQSHTMTPLRDHPRGREPTPKRGRRRRRRKKMRWGGRGIWGRGRCRKLLLTWRFFRIAVIIMWIRRRPSPRDWERWWNREATTAIRKKRTSFGLLCPEKRLKKIFLSWPAPDRPAAPGNGPKMSKSSSMWDIFCSPRFFRFLFFSSVTTDFVFIFIFLERTFSLGCGWWGWQLTLTEYLMPQWRYCFDINTFYFYFWNFWTCWLLILIWLESCFFLQK